MVKLGIIQTCSFSSNEQGINKVSKMLEGLGRKEVDIVCLPAQPKLSNRILYINFNFKASKRYFILIPQSHHIDS